MTPQTKVKCQVVSGFCLEPGRDVMPGAVVELTPYQARIECDELKRAKRLPAESGDDATKALALAEAHAELLDRIATAPTITGLEQLLSEDPDIVAAYEKRLAELEEAAGIVEAAGIMEGFKAAESEAEAISLLASAQSEFALNLLRDQIPAEETGLHAAIAARLAELDEPDH